MERQGRGRDAKRICHQMHAVHIPLSETERDERTNFSEAPKPLNSGLWLYGSCCTSKSLLDVCPGSSVNLHLPLSSLPLPVWAIFHSSLSTFPSHQSYAGTWRDTDIPLCSWISDLDSTFSLYSRDVQPPLGPIGFGYAMLSFIWAGFFAFSDCGT